MGKNEIAIPISDPLAKSKKPHPLKMNGCGFNSPYVCPERQRWSEPVYTPTSPEDSWSGGPWKQDAAQHITSDRMGAATLTAYFSPVGTQGRQGLSPLYW